MPGHDVTNATKLFAPYRGNVGEVLAGKDDRGAIAQLARDLELEQVRTAQLLR